MSPATFGPISNALYFASRAFQRTYPVTRVVAFDPVRRLHGAPDFWYISACRYVRWVAQQRATDRFLGRRWPRESAWWPLDLGPLPFVPTIGARRVERDAIGRNVFVHRPNRRVVVHVARKAWRATRSPICGVGLACGGTCDLSTDHDARHRCDACGVTPC